MRTGRVFFKFLCLSIFLCDISTTQAKSNCVNHLQGDPDLYIYTQDGNMDKVLRGEWPWSNRDGFPEMIGRARAFIASKDKLNQKQNTALWEAFAERISFHTRGYMKNHKTTLEDRTVVFYSEPSDTRLSHDSKSFYYFLAFPPDGSMHYGKRQATELPTEPDFNWQIGNENLRKLK